MPPQDKRSRRGVHTGRGRWVGAHSVGRGGWSKEASRVSFGTVHLNTPHVCPQTRRFLGCDLGEAVLRGKLETPVEGLGETVSSSPTSTPAPAPSFQPRAAPSPAVPTDLVRGIPFRREPGSFSGPGRPWRSNKDCGSWGVTRRHGGSQLSSPSHPPQPEVKHPMH